MALGNFIFLLMALVAVNVIFADSNQPSQAGGDHQDAPPPGGPNQEPNGRFFGYLVGGNYTGAPGARCLSCITTSRCPSNVQNGRKWHLSVIFKV